MAATQAPPKSQTGSRRNSSRNTKKKRTRGFEVIRWIETHCVHTNGRWIGQPFRLFPWEKAIILRLFTLEDTGRRLFRWALIGVPKKNGKTELAAALALFFLIGDGEPAPLVVCAGAAEDQADLVFGAAKVMCEQSPTLRAITDVYEREITVPSIPGARLKRVAAVAGTNDGQNIHVVICDELHEWVQPKHEQTWNVLTNGSGARLQPMVLQITTAGYDKETVLGRQYEHGRAVEEDPSVDPRFFFYWQQAPDGCDHKDPEAWRAANPSYGITVNPEYLADQISKKPEGTFRRYFLNQWTETEDAWISAEAWDACYDPSLDLDPGLPTHVGLDLGLKHDSSARLIAQLQGDKVVVRSRIWENPYPPDHSDHDTWRLDIVEVENELIRLAEGFPKATVEVDGTAMPGPAYWYDPHFFERSAQVLSGHGLAMVEFRQYDSLMAPASQALFELIVQKRLAHNGDPALRRHVLNAVAKETDRGWRIQKPRGAARRRKKIDGAIALAMAAWKAESTPVPEDRRQSKTFRTY